MAVEDLDDATFAQKLGETELAVVDFYAGWCGPCMMFKPKFARLSDEYPHVRFFICDGEQAPEARKSVDIPNLPYFGIYRGGALIDGFSTAKEEGFREKLEAHFGKGPAAGGVAE